MTRDARSAFNRPRAVTATARDSAGDALASRLDGSRHRLDCVRHVPAQGAGRAANKQPGGSGARRGRAAAQAARQPSASPHAGRVRAALVLHLQPAPPLLAHRSCMSLTTGSEAQASRVSGLEKRKTSYLAQPKKGGSGGGADGWEAAGAGGSGRERQPRRHGSWRSAVQLSLSPDRPVGMQLKLEPLLPGQLVPAERAQAQAEAPPCSSTQAVAAAAAVGERQRPWRPRGAAALVSACSENSLHSAHAPHLTLAACSPKVCGRFLAVDNLRAKRSIRHANRCVTGAVEAGPTATQPSRAGRRFRAAAPHSRLGGAAAAQRSAAHSRPPRGPHLRWQHAPGHNCLRGAANGGPRLHVGGCCAVPAACNCRRKEGATGKRGPTA